ncbi:MAG TPA: hypothetical protein PKM63_21725 [Panacibacter sp.]|nr:hypothetical protein [Panacibacter sp.]HNP46932.1 hypothetical protein [Panacibacter sp.]
MDATDQKKLLDQGFVIIREDAAGLRIKAKTKSRCEWHTLQRGFKSYSEMRRVMDALLDGPLTVED